MPKDLSFRVWELLMIAFIGEQFDVGNELCGIVIGLYFSKYYF